jgi:hypothetical protein
MAGVAGPMLRRTRSGGTRFLLGLATGGAAAGILLSLPVFLVGSAVDAVAPARVRLLALAALLAGLAVADLLHRTPHLTRQVPERLVWKLPPGSLGLAWGFDIGLLFTTQKTTSLVWAAVAATALVGPSWSAPVLVTVALAASLAIALWSAGGWVDAIVRHERYREWLGWARRGAGVTMAALCVATVLQTWPS